MTDDLPQRRTFVEHALVDARMATAIRRASAVALDGLIAVYLAALLLFVITGGFELGRRIRGHW